MQSNFTLIFLTLSGTNWCL